MALIYTKLVDPQDGDAETFNTVFDEFAAAIGEPAGLTVVGSAWRTDLVTALERLGGGTARVSFAVNIDGSVNTGAFVIASGTDTVYMRFNGSHFYVDKPIGIPVLVSDPVATPANYIGLYAKGDPPTIYVIDESGTVTALGTAAGTISAPTLNAITGASDGDYTVDWDAVSGATGYQLEEDDNSSFTSPTVVYPAVGYGFGANTDLAISSKAAGTWYYRVRANDGTNTSSWSTTRSATVEGASAQIWDDTVAYWRFEEESGVRYDAKGDYDLADNNTVLYSASGMQDNAADFEAANSEYLSGAARLNINATCSIYGWVKPETLTDYQAIIAAGSAYGNGGILIRYGSGGVIQTNFYRGAGGEVVSINSSISVGFPLETDAWQFFCVTCVVSGNTVTLNCKTGKGGSEKTLAASTEVSGTFTGAIDADNSAPKIGVSESGASNYLDGLLDEMSVVNRVLTSDEIDWLFNAGAGRTQAAVAAYNG